MLLICVILHLGDTGRDLLINQPDFRGIIVICRGLPTIKTGLSPTNGALLSLFFAHSWCVGKSFQYAAALTFDRTVLLQKGKRTSPRPADLASSEYRSEIVRLRLRGECLRPLAKEESYNLS